MENARGMGCFAEKFAPTPPKRYPSPIGHPEAERSLRVPAEVEESLSKSLPLSWRCSVSSVFDIVAPYYSGETFDPFILFLCGKKKYQKEATGGAPLQESPTPVVAPFAVTPPAPRDLNFAQIESHTECIRRYRSLLPYRFP